FVTGCATDFCVDTTVRSAASKDYEMVVVSDAHTTGDRPHLGAEAIIEHHNWVWENFIPPGKDIMVAPAERVIEALTS
ncbi:MAG: isochorismatase family protein, partial [Desulfobacterales bacterium]|nr:isochorismatase family protein [Desulfobacterales bacterium]